MNPLASSIISLVFIIFGGTAVYTMMARLGREDLPNSDRYRTLHKVFGWLFVVLFIVMFIFMLARVEGYWEESSPRISLHVALAVALLLLLLVKVTIPRFFKMFGKHLFLLGVSVYLLAFTLVGITAGYYAIWKYEKLPYISHAEIPEGMKDEEIGKELFITKCSTCHILQDIMKPRSAEAWEKVINEMVVLSEPRITVDEASQILHYLYISHTPDQKEVSESASLIERHCLSCHEAQEIYSHRHSESGWREIIKKMNEYDPEIVPKDKIEDIVKILIENQNND